MNYVSKWGRSSIGYVSTSTLCAIHYLSWHLAPQNLHIQNPNPAIISLETKGIIVLNHYFLTHVKTKQRFTAHTILSVKVVTLACRNTASRWDHDFLAVNISAHTLALGLWFVFFMGLSRGICSLLAMWFSTSWFFWGNWDHLNHWWVIGVRFISAAIQVGNQFAKEH